MSTARYAVSGHPPGNTENDLYSGGEVDPAFCELDWTHLIRLYLSHFLSTWNTRTYEFAAVSAQPATDSSPADVCKILFFAKSVPKHPPPNIYTVSPP